MTDLCTVCVEFRVALRVHVPCVLARDTREEEGKKEGRGGRERRKGEEEGREKKEERWKSGKSVKKVRKN